MVYPTNPQSVTDNGRTIDAINSSADAPTSVNQYDITLNTPVNQTSPGKRFFVPEAQVSVCKATTTAGEALVRTQSGTSGLIATNVSQWSANISTAGLQQNGLIELQLTLQARGDEPLSILHEIHFPNVP